MCLSVKIGVLIRASHYLAMACRGHCYWDRAPNSHYRELKYVMTVPAIWATDVSAQEGLIIFKGSE